MRLMDLLDILDTIRQLENEKRSPKGDAKTFDRLCGSTSGEPRAVSVEGIEAVRVSVRHPQPMPPAALR